jgi:hypothetical protein
MIDKPAVFGLVWPVFGVAAAISTLVAARIKSDRDARPHRQQLHPQPYR